ncbi:hypothetical protein [Ornithinimicrobium kibberense]|uniref:hypothetical protein n=1 Tax=Ornithinimicrobium kibberense TaxID=282060 RepID=UPI00360C162E
MLLPRPAPVVVVGCGSGGDLLGAGLHVQGARGDGLARGHPFERADQLLGGGRLGHVARAPPLQRLADQRGLGVPAVDDDLARHRVGDQGVDVVGVRLRLGEGVVEGDVHRAAGLGADVELNHPHPVDVGPQHRVHPADDDVVVVDDGDGHGVHLSDPTRAVRSPGGGGRPPV